MNPIERNSLWNAKMAKLKIWSLGQFSVLQPAPLNVPYSFCRNNLAVFPSGKDILAIIRYQVLAWHATWNNLTKFIVITLCAGILTYLKTTGLVFLQSYTQYTTVQYSWLPLIWSWRDGRNWSIYTESQIKQKAENVIDSLWQYLLLKLGSP